jgi:hypothetical protein
MNIAIEAERANNPIKTGVEHYAAQVIKNLSQIDSENTYILYLRTEPEEWIKNLPKNFKVKVMPFPIFWTQLRISWEVLWNKPDMLFIPASALPLIHPKKSIVTIHDIAWEFFPESFTLGNRIFLKFSTLFAVKFAKKIISVSKATKSDLLNKKQEENKMEKINIQPSLTNWSMDVGVEKISCGDYFSILLDSNGNVNF